MNDAFCSHGLMFAVVTLLCNGYFTDTFMLLCQGHFTDTFMLLYQGYFTDTYMNHLFGTKGFWVSSLAYPNLLGTKGYVVVVVVVVHI
jgi:hypothetical protein